MAKLFNLAQMTTATAGTGTITLGSAVAPFITFAAAGVQNNDVVAYSIIDGANSEMGYGTYSSVGPTLTRVLRKSSTGALLNLSGSAIVRLTPGKEDIVNPDGSIAFVANLDMGSNKIINVTDPSNAQDAATKNYVDTATAGITGSHNPVTLGIANGLALSNQVLSLDLASSTTTGSLSSQDWSTFNSKQAALGFTPENVANKDIDAALAANSDTKYPSQKAVKAYIDAGLATGTHAPVTLGTANGLSLSGQQLSLGFSSGTSAGALSGNDWQLFNSKQAALGFTPENIANKTTIIDLTGTSNTLYPTEHAVSTRLLASGALDNQIIRADGITGSIQNSLATIDDNGGINIPSGTTFNINGSPHTHAGGMNTDGWVSDANTWSYSTGTVVSVNADMTGVISPGMRLSLTQTTPKYFIVTAVGAYSGGATLITIYGGTDYTFDNAAVTSPKYSTAKAPLGFPLDSNKWTVVVTDTSQRLQNTPTQNTWYNLGSISITIPIGTWLVEYIAPVQFANGVGGTFDVQATLSTANNSESDANLTTSFLGTNQTSLMTSMYSRKILVLASSTVYYLNARTKTANLAQLYVRGDYSIITVRATSAYL